MPQAVSETKVVAVKVIEVLPRIGLAWVQASDMQEWALTRSTPGVQLEDMQAGQMVMVQVREHEGGHLPVACH
jgi:hypothetical protein